MIEIKQLIQLLQDFDVRIDDFQASKLLMLATQTLEKNKEFNLTAIKDENSFIDKMIIDSCAVLKRDRLIKKTVIDCGTGAGFPGLVLAIICPSSNFVLIDSTAKKIKHVEEMIQSLQLENVIAIFGRVEEYAREMSEHYDVVLARALKQLNILLEFCAPLAKIGGKVFAYKGKNYTQELSLSRHAICTLNLSYENSYAYSLPLSKETRYMLEIKKEDATPAKYPRKYAAITKNPL